MVEFIGFSNAREFKALGKWFSHHKGLKLELVKKHETRGRQKRYGRRQSLLFWTSKFGQSTPVLSGYRYGSIRYGQVTDVRLLRPPHPAQCQPGTRCQAWCGLTVDGRNLANHLECMNSWSKWDKLPTTWCRISFINSSANATSFSCTLDCLVLTPGITIGGTPLPCGIFHIVMMILCTKRGHLSGRWFVV